MKMISVKLFLLVYCIQIFSIDMCSAEDEGLKKIIINTVKNEFMSEGKLLSEKFSDKKNSLVCYSGRPKINPENFSYEYFPQLNLLCVISYKGLSNIDAVVFISPSKDEDNVIDDEQSHKINLTKGLEQKILSVASGMLRTDQTSAELSCEKMSDSYFLVKKQLDSVVTEPPTVASFIIYKDKDDATISYLGYYSVYGPWYIYPEQ